MPVLKYFTMKTFKFNSEIFIICCALIASGDSVLETHIGSDGRVYLIEDDYEYTWFEAWKECARHNSQLLTIDSPEKQNVINKVFKKSSFDQVLWLGANDGLNSSDKADRPFFWSATGKQLTYTNWETSFPRAGQHCVQIRTQDDKKWISYLCNDRIGFICEEKQLLESSNKNPNNACDGVQQFIKGFDLKFLNLLKDNMAELTEKLENKLTNITQTEVQKILNKQELSRKELNYEITKQGSDLSDQLKRSVDELNAKFCEKQNFTYHPKNIVLFNQAG